MRFLACATPVFSLAILACGSNLQPIPVTPEITTSALEDGAVGTPYTGQLRASGGTGPYTWSLESVPGELSSWLHVDSATGAFSGIPTAKVSPALSFVARVTDSWSTPRTSTRTLTLAVKSCTPGATVSCSYTASEQCLLSSLVCSGDGSVLGTCSGGTPSSNMNYCGSSCGACSTTVADNCGNGTCMCGTATACAGSNSCCSGNCKNTQEGDPSNCGSCGHACSLPAYSSALCSGGQCDFSCESARAKCGNACVPEDMSHCGSSCATCSATTSDNCSGGTCKCGANAACSGTASTCCSSSCTDTQTDINHCGSCSPCPTFTAAQLAALHMSGVTCQGGKCTPVCAVITHQALYADCDGNLSNGCETNIGGGSSSEDMNNCGGCGIKCDLGPNCCCVSIYGPNDSFIGRCVDAC